MICPACKADLPGDALFCDLCGFSQEKPCLDCKTLNRPAARFCRNCRAEFGSAAGPTPSSPLSSLEVSTTGPETPGIRSEPPGIRPEGPTIRSEAPTIRPEALRPRPAPAMPPHLADRILQGRAALEGERKQVTVMFADVQGSMDLAERMDPEVWSGIMQRFFAILSEGVERFEGFVDKFTGDGIMALFGAPIAHEDHAQRACHAALYLRGRLQGYATDLKREHGLGFSTRIGLHSGEVVVGAIGDDLRMEYTAQGHTVGLAQRMESLASPDTCYLSAATAALVADYVDLEDLGEFRVKGLSEPVRVHRLVGASASRTRFDVSRSRGLSRFVGRDRDLRMLEDALAEAQGGRGLVVGVVAEAGTGKSRLCHEFAERCRARGLTVNFGRALAHGKHLPYLPMLEVFRAYYGIAEGDDDRTARERIAGRLLLMDEALRELLPVVFEFFGVSDPARPAPAMDPDAKQRQVFSILRRGIQDADADASHLVVVIEDLHWLDPSSEALVAGWVEALAGSSAMLVVNTRPEYRAEWMQRPWYRRLSLQPLGPEATRELLGDLLGHDASVAGLAERIHEQTSGNPFFTEEVVRSLAEAGDLVGARGAYRLAVEAASIRVPPSVHGILSARIDRLAERDKLVLQTAAVLGQVFAEPLLATVAGVAEDETRTALANLQAAGLVYEQSAFPVAEYAFQHALTREVALRSQLQERRRRLHAAAADAIEAAHAERLDAQAALLAHHREEAGETLVAADWQMCAARWVRQRDFAAAARHAAKALELVRQSGDLPGAPLLGANVCREMLSLALRSHLDADDAQRIFEEGLAWAGCTGDEMLVARLHQAISVVHSTDARPASALEHAGRWAEIAAVSSDPELRACAAWPSLGPLVLMGELAQARELALAVVGATEGRPAWGLRDWAMSAQANALLELSWLEVLEGNLPTARTLATRAIEIARIAGDVENQCLGLIRLAAAIGYGGDVEASRAPLQRMAELTERSGSGWIRDLAQVRWAVQSLAEGGVAAAVDLLENALHDGSMKRSALNRLYLEVTLAECLRAAGRRREALEVASAIRAKLQTSRMSLLLAETDLVLARILLEEDVGGDTLAIEGLLDEVDDIVVKTGARLHVPFALVERAALAQRQGDAAAWRRYLEEAMCGFEVMGATGQVRRVEAELALSRRNSRA